MNPEIKAKWIEALRSGKYKQGQNRLRSIDNHFCCLGVLCDVMGAAHEPGATHPRVHTWRTAGLLSDAANIPEPVSFAGHRHLCLIDLNDAGADFNFIADVIEEQL